MAFLDNSGDIILDAVLTDTGRYRLAKGDGSFRIAKFALGDDEIDYSLYDKTAESAYTDVDILSTPVLEAFTDNLSGLKSKLLSIPRNDLLFLPVIKLNTTTTAAPTTLGIHCVACDKDTENKFDTNGTGTGIGIFKTTKNATTIFLLQQGLDTVQIPASNTIDSDLKETQYIVEIDSRLGMVLDPSSNNNNEAAVSYIDDDGIASYYFTFSSDTNFVGDLEEFATDDVSGPGTVMEIQGPRGTGLEFKIKGTLDLQYSTYIFEQLGAVKSLNINGTGTLNYHTIDSTIRVTGATTGYRVDIPVRFLKLE